MAKNDQARRDAHTVRARIAAKGQHEVMPSADGKQLARRWLPLHTVDLVLALQPGPISMGKLAGALDLRVGSREDLKALVFHFVAMGVVEVALERESYAISLTPKGRIAAEKIIELDGVLSRPAAEFLDHYGQPLGKAAEEVAPRAVST